MRKEFEKIWKQFIQIAVRKGATKEEIDILVKALALIEKYHD